MSEIEQLKKRIDDSGTMGVETAFIRDDYEPVMEREYLHSRHAAQCFLDAKRRDNKWAKLKPGDPCGHLGCLHHVSHPCEGCGRIAGQTPSNAEITGGEAVRVD